MADIVTVRLFAAAKSAAGGTAEVMLPPGTVGAVTTELERRFPALGPVLPRCSYLVDGLRAEPATVAPAGSTIDVLPPFAGG